MSGSPTLQHISCTSFELLSGSENTRKFGDKKGEIQVVAMCSLGVHESLIGTHFRVNYPSLVPRIASKKHGLFLVTPVAIKVVKPDDGPPRLDCFFHQVKTASSGKFIALMEPITAEARELVEKYLFNLYLKMRKVAISAEGALLTKIADGEEAAAATG